MKCIVKGCSNHQGEGKFVDTLCSPCHTMLTQGKKMPSEAWFAKPWVGLTQTQVKLLREGVHEESIKTGDSIDWVFYTHINEALKEKNT